MIVCIPFLCHQVKTLDTDKAKLLKDVNDLQNRVARDDEKDEENRKDIYALKQKVWSKSTP